jgi:type VI secretion system protein ImpK
VETSGAGDSQPVATPPSQPANRARNRRVDILFIPEAG